MIELIKDRDLFEAVRSEAMSAYVIDETTGTKGIDAQKLINLPLLQSLYIEIMRLHVSFNVTRKVMQPIQVDGYMIEKGALLQTCSQIAHFEDAVWATPEHPASEFWAWRHVQYVDARDESTGETTRQPQFAMKGRPSSFFPYGMSSIYPLVSHSIGNITNCLVIGGGYVMCPGRHFAKQEIMLAIAVLVTKFDIEFVEWVDSTGNPSDRPAQDDSKFAGFIAMSPDREMRIRWRPRVC